MSNATLCLNVSVDCFETVEVVQDILVVIVVNWPGVESMLWLVGMTINGVSTAGMAVDELGLALAGKAVDGMRVAG